MIKGEVSRDGLTWYQWAMREHTRLQAVADQLWDGFDALLFVEDFNALKDEYDEVCDRMDEIEALPRACFEGKSVHLRVLLDGRKVAEIYYGDGALKDQAFVPGL